MKRNNMFKDFVALNEENCPDHIIEEIHELAVKICNAISDHSKDHSHQIFLNALIDAFSAIIAAFTKDNKILQDKLIDLCFIKIRCNADKMNDK